MKRVRTKFTLLGASSHIREHMCSPAASALGANLLAVSHLGAKRSVQRLAKKRMRKTARYEVRC